MEKESWRTMGEESRGIMEKESLKRNYGEGIMEKG